MARLTRKFFERNTVDVAKDLLGKVLVRRLRRVTLKGMIVETEAYRGSDDPASHAYRGITPRNSIMFMEAGLAYIYLAYGNHYCFNVTTEPIGVPGAVLIRALEPLNGLKYMFNARRVNNIRNLTNGPGKLTRALSIDRSLNGKDLVTSHEIFIEDPPSPLRFDIVSSPRIGVKRGIEKPWRFYIKDNPFVSTNKR